MVVLPPLVVTAVVAAADPLLLLLTLLLQEGKTDVDYLREEELINGLKISSSDHTPVTLYQISIKVGTNVSVSLY